ncbi:MAG: hypothetical protein QNJ69_07950 [Gammaproteobacteria bacterium]|nr:hypothetical protein [Gammaproteobacteria bacterium]
MKFITCDNMRRLVSLSVTSLVAGLMLFLLYLWLGGPMGELDDRGLFYVALALILTSPLVLLINLIVSLIPGSRQILKHCNH